MPFADFNSKKILNILCGEFHSLHLWLKQLLMNPVSFPVVHPAFERLKRLGRILHLIAAAVLIAHAFGHLGESYNPVYFWCQLIFAIDILLLIFVGRNIALTMPGINAFFRFIEALFFLGIAALLFFESRYIQAGFHIILSLVYAYLFYCEKKLRVEQLVSLYHSGILIPGLPSNQFLFWTEINRLNANYSSIEIETGKNDVMKLDFCYNLSFDELAQIHDFCRHYLAT